MKKLVLTIACAMAMTGAAFAQGWINYSLSFSSITMQTNTAFSPLFGGSGSGGTVGNTGSATGTGLIYDYILLAQAFPGGGAGGISTDTAVWDGTWFATTANGGGIFTGTNGNTAGRISTVQTAGNQQVSWANGVTNGLVLVGWSANLGGSWAAVSNALKALSNNDSSALNALLLANGGGTPFFGETSFGYINPNLNTPGAAIVGNGAATANGLPLFSLNTQLYSLIPVPEPTTMALAGLGGLGLLLFRRRK